MTNVITGKCSALLNRHGGLQPLLREYGIVRLLDGALREAWEAFGMRLLHWLGRGPRRPYSWLDALLSPTCDYWVRYTQVIGALEQAGPGMLRKVIEVSSGGRGGLAWALPGTTLDICLVDWSAQLLSDTRGGKAWRVCADACQLPFADNSFDAAVSLDTLEHLPRRLRASFLDELRRVAKASVIVTCPLQSGDRVFQARGLTWPSRIGSRPKEEHNPDGFKSTSSRVIRRRRNCRSSCREYKSQDPKIVQPGCALRPSISDPSCGPWRDCFTSRFFAATTTCLRIGVGCWYGGNRQASRTSVRLALAARFWRKLEPPLE